MMNPTAMRNQYAQRFKDSHAPIVGLFEITGRCNFNCKMCYVHTKPNSEFLKAEKDGDWWIEQINAACEKGMLFATLSGGECLMHPDFRKIYLHLRDKGVYTQINTNGLLLTQKNIDFLKEYPPFEIQLTVYAADDFGYEKVTGVNAYKQVFDAISRVREAGLQLRLAITPNAFAPNETERLVHCIKEMSIPYSVTEGVFTPYSDENEQALSSENISVDEMISYMQLSTDGQLQAIPDELLPPIGGTRSEELRGMNCSAGRVSFIITHDGFMVPCTSMYHCRIPVKSADDFEMAWEKMMEINRNFLMPIECEGCAYRKACLSCPILRGGKVGNGHCDPAVCEMTRKLVAAGVKKLDIAEQGCE